MDLFVAALSYMIVRYYVLGGRCSNTVLDLIDCIALTSAAALLLAEGHMFGLLVGVLGALHMLAFQVGSGMLFRGTKDEKEEPKK